MYRKGEMERLWRVEEMLTISSRKFAIHHAPFFVVLSPLFQSVSLSVDVYVYSHGSARVGFNSPLPTGLCFSGLLVTILLGFLRVTLIYPC